MIRRFRVWNRWCGHNSNIWINKILVLIGILKSPTFEVELHMDKFRVGEE